MNTNLLARLNSIDTPTLCNAIEVAQKKRGFSGFTHAQMTFTGAIDQRVVGLARTARIAGNSPSELSLEQTRALRRDYFRYMASGPRPGIAIVEDVDGAASFGAWWGEVHAQVHKNVFQLAGAVTNGLVRDLPDLPPDFPISAGAIGPSHGFVHVVDFGQPVEVFGMQVTEGDWVHADCHGAVCVPSSVLPELEAALDKLFQSEAIVLEPVKAGGVDLETFEQLWAEFERART